MDDDDTEVMTIPGRKLAAIDVLITAMDSFTSFLDDVNRLLCQHANWKIQRRLVADEMRAAIETIVSNE